MIKILLVPNIKFSRFPENVFDLLCKHPSHQTRSCRVINASTLWNFYCGEGHYLIVEFINKKNTHHHEK